MAVQRSARLMGFRIAANGLLSDDVFVVYLKTRQEIPENQDFKIFSCSSSVTATVTAVPCRKDAFIVCP